MFHATGPLDLDCMNKLHRHHHQQHLLQRYESEEEDISESEVGTQENSFSPVEFQRFDSDVSSADEMSTVEDSDQRTDYSHLISTYRQTTDEDSTRPVSIKTIKRRSDVTFVAGSYLFDHDDDMIIELPSPDESPVLEPPAFLQNTTSLPYAPEPGQLSSSSRQSSRSPSPASLLSDDESDVCIAEQVTYMEPCSKPNLILISPTTSQPSPTAAEPPTPTREEHSRSPPVTEEQEEEVWPLQRPTGIFMKRASSKRSQFFNVEENTPPAEPERPRLQRGKSMEPMAPSTTINCLSEVPTVPHPMSSRSQSIAISRPQTSFAEQPPAAFHSRFASKSLRRPPSIRSLTSFAFPWLQSRPSSPRVESPHARSMSVLHTAQSQEPRPRSRGFSVASPAPYCSSPAFDYYDRSDSTHSPSNVSNTSSFWPVRQPTIKHSTTSSIYSTNSYRSEVPSEYNYSLDGSGSCQSAFKEKATRSRSFRRNKTSTPQPDSGMKPSGKSFLGLRLGKRKSTTIKGAQSST